VVAPFDDQGEGLRGFADQLTVQLTDAMLAVPALSVTPSAYVTPLHGASLDSLVARFHPDVLILGRIQPAAKDSVRLSVQVADPANRRALSTDDAIIVARSDSAVGASVQQLSASVRGALWKEIDREQRRARIRDPRAWADVEKARGFVDVGMEALQFRLDQRGFYSLAVADSLLQVAEQRDPSADLIPVERAYLAERRSFIAEWLEQNGRRLPAEVPRVDDERSRALGILNPLIRSHHGPADAFEVRGLVKRGLYRTLHQDSLLTAAIADFRAATELDLHRATAWKELAMAQSEAGLFTDALLSVTSALREDVFELHRVTLLRGRFDAAIRDGNIEVAAEACAAWLRIAPAYMRGFDCELLLWSRTRGDRRTVQLARARADSIRAAGDSVGLVPLMRSLYVAEIMARSGLADSADATARRATGADPARWGGLLVTEFAYYKLLRGDRDGAVALIVGVAERDPTIRHELSAVVWWQPLRSDPRVAALIKGATSPVPSTAP
jgi:tetratricopeptide (TPR) repeat protein